MSDKTKNSPEIQTKLDAANKLIAEAIAYAKDNQEEFSWTPELKVNTREVVGMNGYESSEAEKKLEERIESRLESEGIKYRDTQEGVSWRHKDKDISKADYEWNLENYYPRAAEIEKEEIAKMDNYYVYFTPRYSYNELEGFSIDNYWLPSGAYC